MNLHNEDNRRHPLTIYLVAQRIFSLMQPDVATLKNIRLVCKTWWQETLPRWTSHATLRIIQGTSSVEEQQDITGLKITELLQTYSDRSGSTDMRFFSIARLPLTRVTFVGWTIKNDDDDSSCCGADARFWSLVQGNITNLKLKNCVFSDKRTFYKMVLLKTRNLRELTTSGCVIRDDSRRNQNFDELLQDPEINRNISSWSTDGEDRVWLDDSLLAPFQNLSKVRTRSLMSDCENFLFHSIDVNRWEHGNLAFPNLKHVDVMHTCSLNSAFIRDFGFELETLVVELVYVPLNIPDYCTDFWGRDFVSVRQKTVELLHSFSWGVQPQMHLLENSNDSLKVLKVFRDPRFGIDSLRKFNFCTRLTKLEELHLYGSVVCDLDFLVFTPKLKRLYLSRCGRENWGQHENIRLRYLHPNTMDTDIIKESIANLPVMEDMEVFSVDFNLSQNGNLDRLAGLMPHLRTLKMQLNDANIPEVARHWPELNELVLYCGSSITDEGISTIATGLRNLKAFELQVFCGHEKLTDECVDKGFARARLLRKAKLCVSSQFSEDGEDLLRSLIPEVFIIRNYTTANCVHESFCRYFSKQPRRKIAEYS